MIKKFDDYCQKINENTTNNKVGFKFEVELWRGSALYKTDAFKIKVSIIELSTKENISANKELMKDLSWNIIDHFEKLSILIQTELSNDSHVGNNKFEIGTPFSRSKYDNILANQAKYMSFDDLVIDDAVRGYCKNLYNIVKDKLSQIGEIKEQEKPAHSRYGNVTYFSIETPLNLDNYNTYIPSSSSWLTLFKNIMEELRNKLRGAITGKNFGI
jgi:hypothetical protein